jgi:hypothetical protein
LETPAAAGTEGLSQIVQEIRDELAQITARELELRRRERELGRRYRLLKEVTREAGDHEGRERQQTLINLAAELNAQAVDIAARQARVGEVAEQLRAQQVELDQRRSTSAAEPGLQRSPATTRENRWLRSTVLAAGVALLAGLVWFLSHPPLQRATMRIQIMSENPAAHEVATAHRAQLLDPHLLDGRRLEAGLAEAWRSACEEGQAAVRTADDEPVLWLSLTAPDGTTARHLIAAACAAYAERLPAQPVNSALPLGYQDLVLQRERLEAALQGLRQQEAAEAASLASTPALPEREEIRAAADRLEAEFVEVAASLERQRTVLTALAALDDPRGNVDPAQIEEALAQDTITREDQQEYRATALQYRTELAVALLQLDEPAKAVQKAVTQFAVSLQEQRGLEPPPDVAKILEDCAAAVSGAQTRWTSLAAQWRAGSDAVQKMTIGDDVAALVAQQSTAADAARRAGDEAVALVDDLGGRIEALGHGGDGGTRRVVVAAVLKTDHDTLKSATEAFVGTARKIALADNIQLDAHDRKLRGLRMRLNSRQEAVHQQLQLEADRVARERHAAQLAEARAQVGQYESRREELVTNLVAALRQLRAVDEAAHQRASAELRQEQRAAEIAWRAARSAEIAQELANAQQRSGTPDRAEFGEPTVTAVAPGRTLNAVLVGAATFVGAWLAAALMMTNFPRLRGNSGARPLPPA